MEENLFYYLFYVWLSAASAMFCTWLRQLKSKDASYVDVVWSAGIGISALVFFLYNNLFDFRHIIILLCALFWSFRLSCHLTSRLMYLKEEDSRYNTMRKVMGARANIGFLIFFQVQAVFIVMFAAPIIIALSTNQTSWQISDYLGLVIFIIAFVGETIADKQLLNHRKQHGANITCQDGLWYYSRHPNYFFEWIHWFAYACFAISSSYFWLTSLMPFLMLFFIIYVTGIPHAEREAMSKKPDYLDYKKSTPMLILNIFKK